ncbi:MAG: hypothetical protein N4A74_08405 [Carboxylicivirga sp.]|jgi:hypothetical protein|nr:hypothetical protein [Carboxylicivirga sp.]
MKQIIIIASVLMLSSCFSLRTSILSKHITSFDFTQQMREQINSQRMTASLMKDRFDLKLLKA